MRRVLGVALVIAMLAGGCAWVGPAEFDPESVLDHFLCYRIRGAFDGADVALEDQFPIEPKVIHVSDRVLLCNPVDKTTKKHHATRKYPETHLVCYDIPQERFDRKLTVSDQLRKQVLFDVDRSYLLCLPSGKGPENGGPPAIPTNIDHFKCYLPKASGLHLNIPVHLKDQFLNKDFTVIAQSLLCNPVEKTVVRSQDPTVRRREGDTGRLSADDPKKPPQLLNKDAHLVCYLLDPLDDLAETRRIANQFEPNQVIKTLGPSVLCVPATKKDR